MVVFEFDVPFPFDCPVSDGFELSDEVVVECCWVSVRVIAVGVVRLVEFLRGAWCWLRCR